MPSFIPELIQRIESVSLAAQECFEPLETEQLNWKPDPKAWSIGQCLDHLITTNELYLPVLAAAQNAYPPQNIFSRLKFFSAFFGRMLRKQLGAKVVNKAKSPKNFQPSQSHLPADILTRFLTHQKVLIEAFAALPDQDYSQMMMISPAAAFVTYSVEDALHILAGHEERHLGQAKRLIQMPGFPTNLQN